MLKKCVFVTVAASAALAVAVNNVPTPKHVAPLPAPPDACAQAPAAAAIAAPVVAPTAAPISSEDARTALFSKGLHFEPNLGQAPEHVEYAARGLGYGVFLRGASALLTLQRGEREPSARVQVRFAGADESAASEALAVSEGRSNYMSGDESTWVRNVPRYGAVRYDEIYPGIDVVYYGNQRRLEYDCVVAPGADPDQIRIAIDGTESLALSDDGELILGLTGGDVVQHAPIAYQEFDGRREPVHAEYRIEDDGKVTFDLGPYDRAVALVIDPVISYATYLGGSSSESLGADIAVDGAGHAYVVGMTPSFDFPANVTIRGGFVIQPEGGPITPDGGETDMIIVKFLPDGSDVVYSTRIGGDDVDIGLGIAIDAAGNAYATGYTFSFDYPTAGNPFQRFHGSEQGMDGDPFINSPDAFLSELNATGNGLVYSTYLGGFRTDIGNGVDVDGNGDIYVVGATNSFNFFTNQTAARPFYTGGSIPGDGDGDGDGDEDTNEGFVTKFRASGASLAYSTYITGSTGIETCADVIGNDAGEATVVGSTSSFDFLSNPQLVVVNGGGIESFDAFALRLNANGSDFLWNTQVGGDGDDYGHGLGIDDSDNVYICGSAGNATNFPLLNPLRSTFVGSGNGPVAGEGFVAKLIEFQIDDSVSAIGVDGISVGRTLAYSTFVGGSGDDALFDMDVDDSGAATVIGTTTSLDLESIDAIPDLAPVNNTTMAFLATLDPNGSALTMQTYLGGSNDDWGLGVALGPDSSIFCSGYTSSTDFPVTPSAFQTALADNAGKISLDGRTSNSDYFVVRLDPTPVTAIADGLFIKRIRIRGSGPFGPIVKVQGFIDTGLPLATLLPRLPRAPRLDPAPPFPIVSLNASVQMGPAVFGIPFFFRDTIRVPRNNDNFAPLRRKENLRLFFSDLTLQSDPNVFVELKAHRLEMSSRARFRLIFNGDVTPAVFPGSNFTVSISTPAFAGSGTATLADGRSYDFSRRPGALVAPDFVVRRLKSNLRPRPRGDQFSFVAAFTHTGAPSSAPDLRVGFGSGFDTTVPGSQFNARGRNRFVFRGNSGGIRFAEVDYERNLIRVFGNGLDLEGFAEPAENGPKVISVPVQLLVGLDDDVRTINVLAARAKNKLRY